MKQSTFSAVMANSIKNLLQGYTKGIRFLLVMLLTLCVSADMWAESVTYTVTSTSAVTASGTAPDGSSADYSSTYSTKCQLTKNNSMTLTLSGYDGCTITGLTLSMKSNKDNGAGNMSMKIGSTTVSSISTANFNNTSWNGAWSTTYVDVNPSVTATTVGNGEEIVITIAATVNSLYCQSFTLTYTAASSGGEGGGDSGGGDEGGCTWELVTDASSLKAGDKLVIVSGSKGKVAGSISSGYMSSVAVTISNNTITTLPDDAVQLTLGGSSGAWTLANSAGNLLGATAVKKVVWDSGTTTWSISISDSDNNATIQNGTSSYGRFLYNDGSPRFTTYTSDASTSMLLPQIYKEVCEEETCSLTAVDITQDATINITQGEAFHLKAVAMGDVVDVAEYIWEKKTGSSPDVWTVITDEDGDKTTLSYDPCTVENGGIYRCTIKNSEDCQATSNPFTVKVYNLRGINDDWDTPIPFVWNEVDDSYTATLQLDLQPNKLYEFKVNDGTDWYSDNSAGTMIVTNSSNWTMVQNSTAGNTKILTTVGGTYTFTLNYSDASNPKLSVTYPTQETVVYLTPNSNWTQESAYFCVYYFKSSNANDNGWVKMTKDACNQYTASIPAGYNKMIFVRANPEKTTLSWDCAWNQTNDLDVPTSANILYTVADGAWSKGDGAWSEYSPYHTITYDMNGHGSMDPNYVCVGVGYDWSTPTNPSVSGYTFLGWKRDDSTGDSNLYKNGTAYTTFTPTSSETLTAQWETQSHQILYFDGGATTGIVFSGVHEEGYPTSFLHGVGVQLKGATKAHYSFGGWYGNTACTVGPKTEITASAAIADISLYAKWTINQYTVTLNPNYPAGKTGTFTYDAGELVDGNLVFTYDYNTTSKTIEDLYTSLTLDGYEFGGWYNAKGVNPGEVSGSKCTTTGTITGNKTYFAKWSKLYTITLSENGTTTELDAQTSTSYTLPTELSAGSCQDDTKELVGWSTVEIPNPGDKPTSNFYELGETVTLTADQTTFYAVFATGTTTDEIITTEETATLSFENVAQRTIFSTIQQVWEQNGIVFTNNKAESSNDIADYINPVRCYKNSKIIIDCNTLGNIIKVLFKCSSEDYADNLANSMQEATSYETWVTLIPKSKSNIYEITLTAGQTRISTLTVTYEKISDNASSVSYSDYTTICEAIPDPVWGGAVINRNSIQVDCGSMTKLNAAEPNGPATISFPAATNHTLTYDITVTASEGFLVSTNKTDATKYGASVTVSPNKTGDNAGKITQNVYVVAVAPAMSDEDFTGTITLSGKQLAEPQVIDVTANVTCTQYTLTLVDRGVSTEQPTKYYAGETIDEAPADPEGVCTDPIHYVFDGWAEATVAEGSTTYTKVTFPYTVEGNTKFYAVYRYVKDGGADSGDYVKVTENLDDYSGDYLFVYETGNVAFDGGRNNVDDELDATSNTIEVTINGNTIASNATTDAAKFTIAKVDGGYSIQSASGYYIGRSATSNGLNTNETYSANYDLNTITDCKTIKGKGGNILKYNKASDQKRFRYYQSGQEDIALYRKAASYLYTTSPVCGPHLVITDGKDIYVTGGNAGGTRALVIAQQKVSYKATRLNVGPTSQVPDVKVATNGITVGGVVTSDVKVTIDQTKEQQTDGTYTITGTITVQYQPSANNKQEDIQVQLAVDYNAEARDNFTVHARSLPSEFVIVAKSGDKWYALNGDMNTNAANPANGQVTLDNDDNPTKATYAPCNTIYTFDGLPNTGDRTYVRFQGTDGAWLWASSGTNVGIQNNVLKTTPEGSNMAYNWKLYTEDNITYRFGNANSSRQLTLNGEKFGMYTSGVQDIRILPYEAKCLYNYAPSNLKVSVLKGTYVTLTWDAVVGATKYQYSTNGTTWTDAGTEPTVTINDLRGDTEYTYYVRAYHEDAGVSQECIDYAEITFTTANCDDVPTDITYSADMNSIIVSWIANAATSAVNLYSDEEAEVLVATQSVASPCTFTDLAKNTQYYVQILANGTCASPIIPVKTEDVELDIVEWKTDSIVVDINTNETVGVTLENEVSYGSGLGSLAEDLFFSKYFEGSGSLKMIAIYNGTGKDVDLTDYFIYKGHNGSADFDEEDQDKILYPLSELGVIKQGQEIVLYSWPLNTDAEASVYSCSQTFLHSIANESGQDANPRWILCGKDPTNSITPIYSDAMNFNGDDPLLLYKDGEIIDVFGATAGESPENNVICDGYNENGNYKTRSDESWVANDVSNMDYGKTAEDFPNGEIPDDVNVDDPTITAYTARVIMFRKNSVTSGANAVTKNTDDFHTFAEEWEVRQVCRISGDGDLTCAAYQELGTFDYSDYYTKYEEMEGGTSEFDENDRNPDGTVSIYIPDLYKRACSNIRVKLTNSVGEVLTDREYKVPIMITTDQATAYTEANKDENAFYALQDNLATIEVDENGDEIARHSLTIEQVREICKTCDVVIRDSATLTKALDDDTNDHPQVNNVMIYEGASLEIPSGADYNYTINSLSLRRKGDIVASAKVEEGGKLHLPASATAPIYLDMRIDANNWHWFTLPYNCNIADVTWVDGTPAQYNKDWFIMYYDGNSRANEQSIYENHWKVYNGTTIEAGKGYIVGIQGDIIHSDYTFELRFPMTTDVLTNEHTDKTVAVNAWGVKMDITPNKKGWNLVGNPYLDYYKTSENISFKGLSLIKYEGIDPVTGERLYQEGGNVPFLVTPVDGGWYEYQQELASDVEMMPFTAYFVQVGNPNNPDHTDGMELHAQFESDHRGRMSLIRRAPQEVDGEQEPVIVRVEVANTKGESDKTTLIIDDRFTNEYEMNGDFFKWFGDYYRRYTKPVLYSMGADHGKRAFNALSEQLAAQPVALGMFAAQAGDYTFSLTRKRCDLSRVEEVWLYDATTATYTNLMQQDYTFTTAKTEGEGRFYLSVKMKQKTPTAVENVNGNLSLVAHQQTLVLSGLPAEAQVWVYDATGKLLHSEHTTAYQRIYPVQQAGVYFVSVKGQGDAQTLSTIVK